MDSSEQKKLLLKLNFSTSMNHNLDTFNGENDALRLRNFADDLEKCLKVEAELMEEKEALVASLESPFGTGKSVFLKMWAKHLEDRDAAKQQPSFYPLRLNAWESDFCGEPLVSIISGIISAIEERSSKKSGTVKAISKAFSEVYHFSMSLTNSFVATTTGLNPMEAGEYAKGKTEKTSSPFVQLFQQRQKALEELKKAISAALDLFPDQKLLILVDELDRCRPDYAVSYLETIKHIFDIEGLIFILAIDHKHLENSACSLFGSQLNFNEYLRKFVHIRFELPPLSQVQVKGLIIVYLKVFFKGNKRESTISNKLIENLTEWISGCKLSARSIKELFRIVGYVLEKISSPQQQNPVHPLFVACIIMMAALRVEKKEIYRDIANGSYSNEDMVQCLKARLPEESVQWWLIVYLSYAGKSIDHSNIDSLVESLLSRVKVEHKRYVTPFNSSNMFLRFGEGNSFKRVYNLIEHFETLTV